MYIVYCRCPYLVILSHQWHHMTAVGNGIGVISHMLQTPAHWRRSYGINNWCKKVYASWMALVGLSCSCWSQILTKQEFCLSGGQFVSHNEPSSFPFKSFFSLSNCPQQKFTSLTFYSAFQSLKHQIVNILLVTMYYCFQVWKYKCSDSICITPGKTW